MTAQALQQMPYYYTSAASTAGGFIPASFVYPFYDPRYPRNPPFPTMLISSSNFF
jgi:hypothetical protein